MTPAALRRWTTFVRVRSQRRAAARVDRNFIGFDKYRRLGAYHWTEIQENPDYRSKVEVISSVVQPTSSVLDLGCGDAAYVGHLAPRCARIVGVDADADAVTVGDAMLAEHGLANAQAIQAPISKVPSLGLGRFDVVYTMDVIEHLPDPDELLRVASEMVASDGTVIVGTPLFLGRALKSPYHVKEFRREEIRALVERRLEISEERILSEVRQDGRRYDESYFVALCRPR